MLTKMPQKSENNLEQEKMKNLLNSFAPINSKEAKMKLKLRKAKLKDFKEIAEIYKTEFSKSPYNEKWTFPIAFNKVKIFSRYCDIYVLEYEKEIVGFIVVNPYEMFPGSVAFGEEIAVKSEFQRRGFGTFILKEIFKIYKKRGYERFIGIASKKGPIKLYKRINLIQSKIDVLVERKLR